MRNIHKGDLFDSPDDTPQPKKIRRRLLDPTADDARLKRRVIGSRINKHGCWAYNAPGMPPPGPNFLLHATHLDGHDATILPKKNSKKKSEQQYIPAATLLKLYTRALRERGFTLPVVVRPGYSEPVNFVPGHLWGRYAGNISFALENLSGAFNFSLGPVPTDVMVIGKVPWKEEARVYANFVGPAGQALKDALQTVGITNYDKWYVTNVIKFLLPANAATIKAAWLADCLPLLHQELRIVQPKYILCLGADALKALFGKNAKVSESEGQVLTYRFPIHTAEDQPEEFHECSVLVSIHPSEVTRDPVKARQFERNLTRFKMLISGATLDNTEVDVDHRAVRTLEEVEDWIAEVNYEFTQLPLKDRLIAWDAEWHGASPRKPGGYMRTLQASWGHKKAICFVLTEPGGNPCFVNAAGENAVPALMELLQTFMQDKRAVGHFLNADLEWLRMYNFDPIRDCPVLVESPDPAIEAYKYLQQGHGWLDTGMMAHAVEETAQLGLEVLSTRYTTAPRYDLPLEKWKRDEKKRLGQAIYGYGDVPDEILIPYANYDADVTRRICIELLKYVSYDYCGNDCWEALWESMLTLPVIYDMHSNGILIDRDRIDTLTFAFMETRSEKEEQLKNWANWPDFNGRSTQHVKEFLFGETLNGRTDADGKPVRLRPEEGRSLYLEPLLDTSKPPRRWHELKQKNLTKSASPGTSKMILSILAQDNPAQTDQINLLRDQRFLDQVLKSILRPPCQQESGEYEDEDGNLTYDGGLAEFIDPDGRARTNLFPTTETGRWRSARPNLQNVSKSRDPDYFRMLGDRYKHKLRSILKATDGYAFVEFDYKGAELFGMAVMADDATMISHATRALHPDEGYNAEGNLVKGGKHPHPDYYDIHSNVAKLAFRLDCAPTKAGLKSLGKAHFRTLAKNVIFGIAYGRGAKAIALQAKEQGVEVTVDEAQQVIDTIFQMYGGLRPFFDSARDRAENHRWLTSCFGRYRRFAHTSDEKILGEFQRQAQNFPIQSMVASCVNRGLAWMRKIIYDNELQNEIKMLLQIHDAALLEVRYDLIEYVVDELIPYAMQECVPIYPSGLDGSPRPGGPYRLGVDIVVEKYWGEPYSLEDCTRLGIPERFAK